jgi:serine/threonine-protein kinase HipA
MPFRTQSECYVYIYLPGATSPVVAGRFQLGSDRREIQTGRFVYGQSYFNNPDAVPFEPIELRFLDDREYTTQKLKGVFGAIRDAGPDSWGRRVIERHVNEGTLSEVDYLLNSADDRAGALGFGLSPRPPAPSRKFNKTLDLEKLQELADSILEGDEQDGEDPEVGQVEELLLLNTSMGGARPKVVVEDADALWIAKLSHPDKKRDVASQPRVEHAMLTLARTCGLSCAESKLCSIGDRDAVLVKRFDREKVEGGYRRSRMISALTVLGAEDSNQDRDRWSYPGLAEELRRVGGEAERDARELFKRTCFNALITNADDHPRNHALIANDRNWRLSPAYDLVPQPQISKERRDLAMICGDFGRYANAENLVSGCGSFLLTQDEAKAIIDEMEEAVKASWYKVARSVGVSEQDCEAIRGAFAYEGFRYPTNADQADVRAIVRQ